MRGQWITGALAALALGATAAEAAQALPGRGGPGTLPLTACRPDGVQEDVLCGVLEVPEDRGKPAGRKLALSVVVIPAKSATPLEPVFILSGGPGQAATESTPGYVGAWERDEHDVVMVDLRGTGRGAGGLDCPLDAARSGPQGLISPIFSEGPDFYRACRERLEAAGVNLGLYTTPIAMADLDEARRALGYRRIFIEAGSYGTRAALVYARTYGANVRGMFLSGAAPFENRAPLYHAAAAQRALDRIADQCAADTACRARYPSIREDLAAVLARLKAQPATVTVNDPATGAPAQIQLTDAAFIDGLRVLLYSVETGRRIPALLQRARVGDYAPFAETALASGRNLRGGLRIGLLLSVSCPEDLARIDPAEIPAATADSFVGDYRVRGQLAACSVWARGALPADYAAPFVSSVPALIVSGDLDPVTPPKWGETLAGYFSEHLHLIGPGAHVADSDCVTALSRRFFQTGTTKGLDASCAAGQTLPPFPLDP